jgi:DNA-binding beta-propeller fold protein YncE
MQDRRKSGVWFVAFMLILFALAGGGCSNAPEDRAPDSVAVSMNLGTTRGGPSIFFIDTDSGEMWERSFSDLNVAGTPMHTALTLDRRKVFVTMGGDMIHSLRLLVIDIAWPNGEPELTLRNTHEVLPANTGGGMVQEGHGPHITPDERFLLFSEMQNNRLRVYDIENDELLPAITHESLLKPHGLWPNPAQNRIAVPNYRFDAYTVSLWTYDGNGGLTFDREVSLTGSDPRGTEGTIHGAYHHSITWLDDNRFLIDSTQELAQGTANSAMASVWLVDLTANTTTPVLREVDAANASTGVLEGVSYNLIANDRLYVCEGNVEQGLDSPGHVSVWDISNMASPTLITRLSAGNGLPESFVQCHELAKTPDGRYVFAQSFASDTLVQIDTETNTVAYSWDRETVRVPHGIYVR